MAVRLYKMIKKKKSYLDRLEDAIKRLWRKHNPTPIIKAKHTEISVEPMPFVRGHLNPQIAEFLVGIYVKKIKMDHLSNEQIEVTDGILRIKDKNGKLIAETTSPKIIQEYLN